MLNKIAADQQRKTPLTNFELDHASKIFSDSFQKDNSNASSSQYLTNANLIDAIINHMSIQQDSNKSISSSNQMLQKSKDKQPSLNASNLLPFSNSGTFNFNDHIKNLFDYNTKFPTADLMNQHSLNSSINQSSTQQQLNQSINQSISPLHLLHDRNLLANRQLPIKDDLLTESQNNWKLRNVLEQQQKEQQQNDQKKIQKQQSSQQKLSHHIDIEPISPPAAKTDLKESKHSNESDVSNLYQTQNYFQSRIAQAMNLQDKEQETASKKAKMDDDQMKKEMLIENQSSEQKLPLIGLESITSLSELKKQQQLANKMILKTDKPDKEN